MRMNSKQFDELLRREFDVLVIVTPPDDELHALVERIHVDVAAGYEFLAAVIEARFAVIRSGLNMTREVLDNV